MVGVFYTFKSIQGIFHIVECNIDAIAEFLLPVLGEKEKRAEKGYQYEGMAFIHQGFFVFKDKIFKGLFSFARQDDPQGMDHDLEIKGQGDVFNIQQVKTASFHHFLHIFRIPKLYHAPGGQPRFYF